MREIAPPKVSTRLQSLDVMRGFTIACMILVNNNGDWRNAYWPLLHSVWNGWTPTDIVFPSFLFMVGVAMTFSFSKRLGKGESARSLFPHIVRRTIILFVLGLVVNSFPFLHLGSLRVYGVLQRIGLCFFFASLFLLWTGTKTRISAVVILLGGYWALMRFVPIPGHGVPGRDIPLLDPYWNLVSVVDRWIMSSHLYVRDVYDPEGLISTLPAIATTLLGVLTGEWLRSAKSATTKVSGMLTAGIAGIIAGEIWNLAFPINKRLWTSSYVLLAFGISILLLAVCYWWIDTKKRPGKVREIWIIFGENAITAYMFSELLASALEAIPLGKISFRAWIYTHSFARIPDQSLASLAYSIVFVAVCFLPVWWMHRKGILLKI